MSIATRLAAVAVTAAALAAVAVTPAQADTTADAEAYYYTHLGPSAAWQHASWSQRGAALRSYLADWEGSEGCFADLAHAYQGTKADPTWVQPGLPVDTAPGSDLLLADYTDGVCGD